MRATSSVRARVGVVGAGVAGVSAALGLLRAGVSVDLYSLLPAASAPSASERSGFGAALDVDDGGIAEHLRESLEAGRYFAHQPVLEAMVEAAPALLDELIRLGVPFERDAAGRIARASTGGATRPRAAYAGVHTGAHVLRVLDLQLLPFEQRRAGARSPSPTLRRFERHELVQLVLDDGGGVIGLVALDRRDGRHAARAYDAVVLATGGSVAHFGRAVSSPASSGSASAAAFRLGAVWANCDLLEHHPTTTFSGMHRRVVAELLRRRGARLWVPRDPADDRAPESLPERDRDHLLERLFGEPGELARPADAARALRAVERESVASGVAGPRLRAFLDLRAVPPELLRAELGELVPEHGQLPVGPAVLATLGGLWVDHELDAGGRLVADSPRNQATSLTGLYAAGEVDFQLHGAGRLGDDALLGCVFEGRAAARAVTSYVRGLTSLASELAESRLESVARDCERALSAILEVGDAGADPFELREELRRCVDRAVDGVDDRTLLRGCLGELEAIADRAQSVACFDTSAAFGAGAALVRELGAALLHARAFIGTAEARHALELDDDGEVLADRAPTTLYARSGSSTGGVEIVRAFELSTRSGSRHIDGGVDHRLLPPPPGTGVLPSRSDRPSSALAPTELDVAGAIARAESRALRFRVRVRRREPGSTASTGHRDEFVLDWQPGHSVLDCLERIRRAPVTSDGTRVRPPAWEGSCAEGRCGACTMLVNGRARLACTSYVDPLLLERGEALIDLEPLSKFPVERDLVVDRSSAREGLQRVEAWVELGAASLGGSSGVRERPDALASTASPCISCGACLEACPEFHRRSDFVGAASIHQARLAVEAMGESAAAGRRLDALAADGGVADCGKAHNCVEVCPVQLPLDESILRMARATTRHYFTRWLRRR